MAPSAILRQHFSGAPLDGAAIEWFRRRGVPITALGLPLAAMMHAVWFDRCRFEFETCRPSGEPQRAIVFLGFDEFGQPADLIGWRPKSGALGSWLGTVSMLGEEQALGPRLGEALMVHPSPLQWLQAERLGCVVVDPVRARSILHFAGPLAVADARQAQQLRKILTVPMPTIAVVERRSAAA